jgi:hypothetical protein
MITNTKIVLFGWEKAIERRSKRKEKKKVQNGKFGEKKKQKLLLDSFFQLLCVIFHIYTSPAAVPDLYTPTKNAVFQCFPPICFLIVFTLGKRNHFLFGLFS